jgi:hypothetical protein
LRRWLNRSPSRHSRQDRRRVLVPQTQDYAPSLANDPKHAHETFQHITPTLMEIAKGSGEQLPARERAHFAHMLVTSLRSRA